MNQGESWKFFLPFATGEQTWTGRSWYESRLGHRGLGDLGQLSIPLWAYFLSVNSHPVPGFGPSTKMVTKGEATCVVTGTHRAGALKW